jgi:hypothetical protein
LLDEFDASIHHAAILRQIFATGICVTAAARCSESSMHRMVGHSDNVGGLAANAWYQDRFHGYSP